MSLIGILCCPWLKSVPTELNLQNCVIRRIHRLRIFALIERSMANSGSVLSQNPLNDDTPVRWSGLLTKNCSMCCENLITPEWRGDFRDKARKKASHAATDCAEAA